MTKAHLKECLLRVRHTPVLLVLGAEIFFGLFVSVFNLALFWKFTDKVLDQERFFFDNSVESFFYNIRTPHLTEMMRFLSFVGMDGILLFSLMIPVLLYWKRRTYEATVFSIMIGGGAVLNLLLKLIIQRPRPTIAPLVIEHSYSFPSGHSMNSFIFFMAVSYYIYHFSRRKKLGLFAFGCSLLATACIGMSRIYLGVHYPSDVLVGFVTGFLWFLMVLLIDKTIKFYKIFAVGDE